MEKPKVQPGGGALLVALAAASPDAPVGANPRFAAPIFAGAPPAL